jgi:hypothetical protein
VAGEDGEKIGDGEDEAQGHDEDQGVCELGASGVRVVEAVVVGWKGRTEREEGGEGGGGGEGTKSSRAVIVRKREVERRGWGKGGSDGPMKE